MQAQAADDRWYGDDGRVEADHGPGAVLIDVDLLNAGKPPQGFRGGVRGAAAGRRLSPGSRAQFESNFVDRLVYRTH